MPFTFNGIGTAYHGVADFRPDGSYVTTEWVVFIYFPIVPLRSCRLIALPERSNFLVYSSQGYLNVEKLPLQSRQILRTYGLMALLLCWVAGLFGVIELANIEMGIGMILVLLLLLIFPPLLVLRFLNNAAARKSPPFSEDALLETLGKLGLAGAAQPPPIPVPAGRAAGSVLPPPLPGDHA